MRGKLKQLIAGFVMLCMAFILGTSPVYSIVSYAAEAKISFSDPSAMVGNDVTVSMNITATSGALGGADVTLTYDASVLEFVGGDNASGGAGSIHLIGTMDSDNTTSFNYTLKFKTLQAGNSSISVSNYEIYDKDVQPITLSHVGNSTVTVTPPATYSSEASLASLKISPGTLSPAFSPEVTSYSANVAGDVNKIAIDANAKDGKAKVVINGSSNLKVGENKVVCKVTAEDGQTVKTYNILVTKAQAPETTASSESSETVETEGSQISEAQVGDLTINIEDITYQVASSFDESTLPEGFEASTISYQGSEIMAGRGIEKDLTLIYLVDAQENGSFFIYDQEQKTAVPFVSIDVTEKSIVILPFEKDSVIPSGFVEEEVVVKEKEVIGWIPAGSGTPEYYVFYGMNWNGEKGLYRLDSKEMTIQRYFENDLEQAVLSSPAYLKVANDFNDLLEDYNRVIKIMIGLIVVSVLLLILVISLLLKKRGSHDDHYDEDFTSQRIQEEMTPVKRRRLEREEVEKLKSYHGAKEESKEVRENIPEINSHLDDDFEIEDLDDILSEDEYKATSSPKKTEDSDDDFEFVDLD